MVGLCDLIPERLETLGEELGVPARFADLDEMIRSVAPDIVAIPTGTEFHYDLCMQVIAHGVHIDVEKPICVDLVQADALLKAVAEKGVRLAVHHQGRTGAPLQAVARAHWEGRIGSLRHVIASGKGYYGGYGLMNIGTHVLNAAHLDRWTAVFNMGYLQQDREQALLFKKAPSLSKKTAKAFVKLANAVRKAAEQEQVFCTFSTRRLLALARKSVSLGSITLALEITVLNKLAKNDRQVVYEVAKRCLGIPRIAVTLADKVRLTVFSEGAQVVTLRHTHRTFELEEIDKKEATLAAPLSKYCHEYYLL